MGRATSTDNWRRGVEKGARKQAICEVRNYEVDGKVCCTPVDITTQVLRSTHEGSMSLHLSQTHKREPRGHYEWLGQIW